MQELKDNFQIEVTFLCYERLVRKLPQSVLNYTESKISNPNIPFKINAVLNKNNFNKDLYDIFVKAVAQEHKQSDQRIKSKWENEIGEYVAGTSTTLIDATKSSYLLYFHYRIILRIFPTNKSLHIMKIKTTSACSFCLRETETLTHLFWYCPKIQIFVKDVASHMRQHYKAVNINRISWFFLKDISSIEALIITVGKYVIHKSKMNNCTPSLTMMLSALKVEAEKEYNGCRLRNEVEKFKSKWGEFARIID